MHPNILSALHTVTQTALALACFVLALILRDAGLGHWAPILAASIWLVMAAAVYDLADRIGNN